MFDRLLLYVRQYLCCYIVYSFKVLLLLTIYTLFFVCLCCVVGCTYMCVYLYEMVLYSLAFIYSSCVCIYIYIVFFSIVLYAGVLISALSAIYTKSAKKKVRKGNRGEVWLVSMPYYSIFLQGLTLTYFC